jgi:hypothetical protein
VAQVMNTIISSLTAHWKAYSAAGVALFVAGVCCMPPNRPRSLDDWWTWIRDSLQTAVPAARHAHPITPADPAKPKQQ